MKVILELAVAARESADEGHERPASQPRIDGFGDGIPSAARPDHELDAPVSDLRLGQCGPRYLDVEVVGCLLTHRVDGNRIDPNASDELGDLSPFTQEMV